MDGLHVILKLQEPIIVYKDFWYQELANQMQPYYSDMTNEMQLCYITYLFMAFTPNSYCCAGCVTF